MAAVEEAQEEPPRRSRTSSLSAAISSVNATVSHGNAAISPSTGGDSNEPAGSDPNDPETSRADDSQLQAGSKPAKHVRSDFDEFSIVEKNDDLPGSKCNVSVNSDIKRSSGDFTGLIAPEDTSHGKISEANKFDFDLGSSHSDVNESTAGGVETPIIDDQASNVHDGEPITNVASSSGSDAPKKRVLKYSYSGIHANANDIPLFM